MGALEEIKTLKDKLDKAVKSEDYEVAIETLDLIKDATTITQDILKTTRLGLLIQRLSKHSDLKISSASKELLTLWQALSSAKHDSRKKPVTVVSTTPKTAKPSLTSSSDSTSKDSRRKRIETVILNALNSKVNTIKTAKYTTEELATLADEIETALFDKHSGITDDYTAQFREVINCLKETNNDKLLENVLSKKITAYALVRMSNDEISGLDRDKLKKEVLLDVQAPAPSGSPTTIFTCGKCKKNNCSYYQMQTRSADEPMTTFVTCLECRNAWKFC